jgi:tetratricopeptide (TPR) repeat protein
MKTYIPIAIIILAVSSIAVTAANGANDTIEEQFLNANQHYKSGRFDEAVSFYEALLRSHGKNGYIFYNLGNAYFRSNNLGKAILNYERARELLPRDTDLDFNLRYARHQMKDAVSHPNTFVDVVFFWVTGVSPSEILWTFAAVNLFFWLVLLLKIFSRKEWSFYLLVVASGFWILTGLTFGIKWYQKINDNRAIIVAEEINVLAGPSKGDTLLFKLHAGTMVSLERSEDAWTLIRLPDKKRGWVQKNGVEPISLIQDTPEHA